MIHTIAPFINFGLLLAILYFLGRKPISQLFMKNRQDFNEKRQLAKKVIEDAEKRHLMVREKWENIDRELETITAKAMNSIDQETKNITEAAERMSGFLKTEAENISKVEVGLAKKQLAHEILEQVEKKLKEELSQSAKLQSEVMNNQINKLDRLEV